MNSLILLLIFLLVGILLKRFLPIKLQTKLLFYLNRFVIYISLPAMVLVYLKDIKFDNSFFVPIITAWGVFILSFLFIYFLSKVLNYSKEILIAFVMIVSFTNSSFLGIPFVKAYFGNSAIAYAIIYDQLGSFLILSTLGITLLFSYTLKKLNLKEIFIKIITFPSFIALVITIFLQDIAYPLWLFNLLKFLSSMLAPVALISIGLNLVIKPPKEEIKPIIIALFLKLIFIPLMLIYIFSLLSFNSLSAKVSIFESAMAPMVTACMLAIMYGIKPNFIATTLGYGVLLSFLTLPIIYTLLS